MGEARPHGGQGRELAGVGVPDVAVVFSLAGELDVASVHELARLHRDAMRGSDACMVIDLTEATFVDVTIARLVAAAARQAVARGGRVAIACRQAPVLRLLRLVDVEGAARIRGDVPEALRALQAVAGRIEHVRGRS